MKSNTTIIVITMSGNSIPTKLDPANRTAAIPVTSKLTLHNTSIFFAYTIFTP